MSAWRASMNRILRHVELLRDRVTDWRSYPFSIPAVAKLERVEFHPKVTFADEE
jgi:predicted ATPase